MKISIEKAVSRACMVFSLFALVACSQSPEINNGLTSTGNFKLAPTRFSQVYSETLAPACAQCHQPGGSATVDYGVNLDFSSRATAFSTLQGEVASVTSRGQCGGVRLVSAGAYKNSYLAAEISRDYTNSNFGGVAGCIPSVFHYSVINLSQNQIDGVISWIQAGAANN